MGRPGAQDSRGQTWPLLRVPAPVPAAVQLQPSPGPVLRTGSEVEPRRDPSSLRLSGKTLSELHGGGMMFLRPRDL